jgi:hypothetical protein
VIPPEKLLRCFTLHFFTNEYCRACGDSLDIDFGEEKNCSPFLKSLNGAKSHGCRAAARIGSLPLTSNNFRLEYWTKVVYNEAVIVLFSGLRGIARRGYWMLLLTPGIIGIMVVTFRSVPDG